MVSFARFAVTGMRALRWFFGVFGLALLLVGAAILQRLIATAGTVYPTPETQTIFFKTYSPERTVAAFDLKQDQALTEGQPSSAGQGVATHQRLIDIRFFINPNDREAVPKALSEDASDQLLRSGAKIVTTENSSEGRVLLRYTSGHTEGEIVIEPLKIGYWSTPVPSSPPADQLPVTARVNIQEKWFRSAPNPRP